MAQRGGVTGTPRGELVQIGQVLEQTQELVDLLADLDAARRDRDELVDRLRTFHESAETLAGHLHATR